MAFGAGLLDNLDLAVNFKKSPGFDSLQVPDGRPEWKVALVLISI